MKLVINHPRVDPGATFRSNEVRTCISVLSVLDVRSRTCQPQSNALSPFSTTSMMITFMLAT